MDKQQRLIKNLMDDIAAGTNEDGTAVVNEKGIAASSEAIMLWCLLMVGDIDETSREVAAWIN